MKICLAPASVSSMALAAVTLAALPACSSATRANAGGGAPPGAAAASSTASSNGATPPASDGTSSSAGSAAASTDSSGGDAASPPPWSGGAGTTADAGGATADAGSTALDGGAPYKGVANSACGDMPRLGVTWFYNWTTSASGCTAAPFVPMVWGHTGTEQTATGIAAEVAALVKAGYDTVLGFNEPDNASQSNISVATAISLWPSLTQNAAVRVGSPATQANTSGQAWFKSFMSQVNADTTSQLRVDFIAAHWYGWNAGSCDAKAANLESYLKWLEGIAGNRPIWLTEWGCLNQSNPSEATVQDFFSGAVAMFARHPRLERYAWYPWTTNNELVDADGGALTSVGQAFATAPAHR